MTDEDDEIQAEITPEEYADLENTIHELIYDKLNDNPLLFSDPDFHENLLYDIHDLFYADLTEANVITHDESIYECIAQIVDTFFHLYYPHRSNKNSEVTDTLYPPKTEEIAQTIEWLRSLPQPTQKTPEWYEYRYNLLTASSIWKALSSESQRNSLIYEKCKPLLQKTGGNWYAGGSLQWGVLYETISIMIYEKKYETRVADFGCIQHPQYNCIGASPDGINVDPESVRYGRMIEVKNIVNREITDKPKEEYWIQMQVQMETCDLDECDFIETRCKEYDSEEAYKEDTAQEWKGVILCFLERDVMDSKPNYKYMQFDLGITHDVWIANTKDELRSTHVLYTIVYWYLDEFSCILVKRNPLWFNAALPIILDTWDTIVKERETGYEHRAPAKKRAAEPVKAPICLLKLDHE